MTYNGIPDGLDSVEALIFRARQVARVVQTSGCTIWACQIAPLVEQLARELEKAHKADMPLFKGKP
jgi:hypothetical protein